VGATVYNPVAPANQLHIMPTLDDAPTIETMAGADVAASDLILIYDVSDQKVKTVSLTELNTSTHLD